MDSEHTGPRAAARAPASKAGAAGAEASPAASLLADVIREMGFRKADEFYIALGAAKISPKVVVNKLMQRLKEGEAAVEEPTRRSQALHPRPAPSSPRRRPAPPRSTESSVAGVPDVHAPAGQVLPPRVGRPDRGLRLPRPRHHDPPRATAPTRSSLGKDAERFVDVAWDGEPRDVVQASSCRSTAWDRHRLLEDLSRTFAEAGRQHPRGALHGAPRR